MIMNPKGRAKVFRQWAAWLDNLGRKESAKYWQRAAEELRKEVMTMGDEGLHDKYKITKTDGTPVDPDAFYFVMRPDNDEKAWWMVRIYGLLCRADNPQLAEDLERKLEEIGPPPPLDIRGMM